jgi:tRNA nucleotidyltransferase (CCA-adding enzyme)
MARYAARLDFAPAPETRALASAAVDAAALDTVSGARIGSELRLLAREPDPVRSLVVLGELGLDAAIAPGFGLQNPETARAALAALPEDGRPDRLVLAAAALDLGHDDIGELLHRLAFEASDRDVIQRAASGSRPLAAVLERARQPSEIAAAAAGAPLELVALAGALGPAEQAWAWLTGLRHATLEIDGDDLLAAGIPQGPAVGRALRAALAAKLDGRADRREDQLAEALRAAGPTG